MPRPSSVPEETLCEAMVWFAKGYGYSTTARYLGVDRGSMQRLYDRWRVRGEAAIVNLPNSRRYEGEFKLEVVQRYLAGEKAVDLALEYGLGSPGSIQVWAGTYRREGAEGLRLKRPPRTSQDDGDEVTRLRRENEQLKAKLAYVEKLQALRASEHD